MSIRVKILAAAVAAALSVTPAFAEILNFSWEYAPGEVATWSQPSDPTPLLFDSFTRVAVSGGTTTSHGPFLRVDFYSSDENGGLKVGNINPKALRFSPAPWMRRYFPRVDTLYLRKEVKLSSFVVVTAAVPEPSTWAMMLIGFAGLGYAGHRASRKSVALAA